MTTFAEAKEEFDRGLGLRKMLTQSLVPVNGEMKNDISIRGVEDKPLEEYYKWQFIYGLIHSGLYPPEFIGAEIQFPKGRSVLRVDAAVFDDPQWIRKYNDYWLSRRSADLEWLAQHLLAVIEFKRDDKGIERAFLKQVKPAMREKDPSDAYVVGMFYDFSRLFIFHRRNGAYLRYDEAKNQKAERSNVGDLSLHLPDPYHYIPSFVELRNRVNRPAQIDRTRRTINDLEIIPSITTVQMQDALSNVLRTLDSVSLVNEHGYNILIQTFALKIFDEKRNQHTPTIPLEFYVTEEERSFSDLAEEGIQRFIGRMQTIREVALDQYQVLLQREIIDWQNPRDVRAVVSACTNFQDFSFVRSSQNNLYQLVFYNFASRFQQQEKAQFLTPLAVIKFLVSIVAPRRDETVFDPCCGIGDFLSVAYVTSQERGDEWKLDDANIYGADMSVDMIALASLNMLLNGDGKAHLFSLPDKGSILWKVRAGTPPAIVQLMPSMHKNGNWDNWADHTHLMKFNVILTNPPFGDDRAYRVQSQTDRDIIEMYETWQVAGGGDKIDLGIVFLENAYRLLAENGRLGIVLSNSIAAIDRWKNVREWLMQRMRIVAVFDLPQNVFAETGVNTTLLIAYKPSSEELNRLNEQGYSIFTRNIQNVGYEKRTVRRNVVFISRYIMGDSFEVVTTKDGEAIVEEDFTRLLTEFREWAIAQEATLQRLFLRNEA
jgi:type I restriction enzyme M protein